MKVSNVNSIETKYDNQQVAKFQNTSDIISTLPTRKDQISISLAGKSAEGKWQVIAGEYNVKNISTNERASMTQKLRQSNLISAEQHLRLMAPLNIKDNLSTRVDYLTMIRESREVAEGVPAAIKSLKILEHLNDLSENKATKGRNNQR
ncbi:hypothetical protein HR060_16795 [Catenovulum sp. SM1970]|uniref:hypothetical protein n=1 Tax=Marinifaba aquimaris TaxID=2741323 RepID=UPI0015733B24|nr:hypothetical protein [Marinifaba aquimaris]NTS78503.1 hypothetical protein [Marinifaba aquimaris]